MDNLKYWDRFRTPPEWALKPIQFGRLKGKTDISPQWRFQAMTEVFGPVGVGWKYEIDRLWTEAGPNDQVFANAQVKVFFRIDGEWSEPVPGVGGNMLIQKEKSGLYANDEGYKMAITDALSTALKAIGVGADIYQGNMSGSKYQAAEPEPVNFDDVFKDISGPDLTAYLSMLASKGSPIEKIKEKALKNQGGFRKAYKAHIDAQNIDQGNESPEQEKAPGNAPEEATGPKLGDDPAALRRFHSMLSESGCDRDAVKVAMRRHQIHSAGKPVRRPFDVESSKDILVSDLPEWGKYLEALKPHNQLKDMLSAFQGADLAAYQAFMFEEKIPENIYLMPHSAATKAIKKLVAEMAIEQPDE